MSLIDSLVSENAATTGKLTFGDRIYMLLKQQKRSKAWLAEQVGISKQAMNYLLNHASNIKFINEIALALDVNPEWLKTGKGKLTIALHERNDIRHLPIMNMQDVSSLAKAKNSVKANKETIVVNAALSLDCFAVLLDNTSMKPLFNQGTILIFDPAKKPCNGSFVIFSIKKTSEVYFRQLFVEGNNIYLKSMDVMYKNISNEKIIIHGTLIESRNRFM